MSAVLNNVLKAWGLDSNKFLGCLRPEQSRRDALGTLGSVMTSPNKLDDCASLLRHFNIFTV
jgi:hypothetical protein